jgi:hypothetical protein
MSKEQNSETKDKALHIGGVMNSISNYVLFRFWMIILGLTGWVLFFIEYCS